MISSLLLLIGCLGPQGMSATQPVGFDSFYEVEGFRRYLESRGLIAFIVMPLRPSAVVACGKKQFDTLVRDYSREFGLDFLKIANDSVPVNFSYLRLTPQKPLAAEAFWKRYGKATEAYGAYSRMARRGVLRRSDEIASFKYRLRPFLTENLRRIDWVEGYIEIVRKGRRLTVPTPL